MSAMDMNGNSAEPRQAGRYFAVLWILFATLAMQFVMSAQGFSSRASAVEKAGSFSVPEGSPSDQALSRPALRATPVADLRFSTDRPDGKSVPGGTGPFLLPTARVVVPASAGRPIHARFSPSVHVDAAGHHIRVRAPPVVPA